MCLHVYNLQTVYIHEDEVNSVVNSSRSLDARKQLIHPTDFIYPPIVAATDLLKVKWVTYWRGRTRTLTLIFKTELFGVIFTLTSQPV